MTADGRTDAFLRLFLEHRDRLERLMFRGAGCRADAADLMQELFLRLWSNRAESPDNPAGYLFRSARNLLVDHHRAAGARAGLAAALSPVQRHAEPVRPDDAFEAGADLAAVERALRRLPDRTRRVFLLNRVHGRTYGDIARALQISVSTVEKDMMRALTACRAGLNDPKPRRIRLR